MLQQTLLRDLLVILGLGAVLVLALWFGGADAAIAKAVYTPNSQWAWELRQWSQYPLLVCSIAALVFLIIWPLRLRFKTLRRLAALWLFSLILGAGLINQVVVQELVERPRPRESVLVAEEGNARLSGHSFPSGHAAIGFMFAVPFFVYRRRNPKAAWGFLAAGTAAGLGVGYGRMVLGAHYLSDVIAAGTIVYATAAAGARLIHEKVDIPNKITLPILALGVWAMVWFNGFTLVLNHKVEGQPAAITLPCGTFSYHAAPVGTELEVTVKGYGAPLSNLMLKQKGDKVYLQRWQGLYRGLSCQIVMQTP